MQTRNAIFLLSLILAAPAASAGESPFGYVYTTDTHPKGKLELEQWITSRRGKVQGDYRLWQSRAEIEYGVTDRLQASVYWNAYAVRANADDAGGQTAGPYVPADIDKAAPYRRGLHTDGWSAEFIYRVLSPYVDPVGLALYVEPSFGKFTRELETKLILQKNFFDDRLVLAYNLSVAPEWEKKSGEPDEKVTELQHTFGISCRFAPGWFAGVEARNPHEYAGHRLSRANREFSAWNLGPTLHYASQSWWFTATWLPQLRASRCHTADQCAETAGRRNLDDLERTEFRLRFGFPF